jgi:hypothetical protein
VARDTKSVYVLHAIRTDTLTHAKTFGTCLEREEFTSDNPSHWAPRTGEEEDVDAHKGDGGTLGWEIGGASYGAGDGHNIWIMVRCVVEEGKVWTYIDRHTCQSHLKGASYDDQVSRPCRDPGKWI